MELSVPKNLGTLGAVHELCSFFFDPFGELVSVQVLFHSKNSLESELATQIPTNINTNMSLNAVLNAAVQGQLCRNKLQCKVPTAAKSTHPKFNRPKLQAYKSKLKWNIENDRMKRGAIEPTSCELVSQNTSICCSMHPWMLFKSHKELPSLKIYIFMGKCHVTIFLHDIFHVAYS